MDGTIQLMYDEVMSIKIHPSPAIIVRADLSIAECLQKMNDHGVGSVLIVEDYIKGNLIGIFTERDLLKKIHPLRSQNQWDQPIRTVMTHPVQSLDISQLGQAAKIMIEKGIRHLPITIDHPAQPKKSLVGMISMRDVLKMLAYNQKDQNRIFTPVAAAGKARYIVNLISKDEMLSQFFRNTIESLLEAEVNSVNLESDILKPGHLLIIDLDHLDPSHWSKFLITKNHDSMLKMVMIIFDPSLQSDQANSVLGTIDHSEKFWIMKKPLDFALFYEALAKLRDEG
jgi:CBS domain-containing protein